MQRIDDVPLLCPTRMAAQALGVDRFRTRLCEKEQLRGIGWIYHVLGPWSVTGFTALLRRTSARVIRGRPVA